MQQSNATVQMDGSDDGQPRAPRPPMTLRVAMCDAWDASQGACISGTNRSAIYAAEPFVLATAAELGLDPEQLFRQAAARFKAAQAGQRRPKGLGIFLEDLALWIRPPADIGRAGTREEHALEFATRGDDFERLGAGPS